ncbi:MAG: T9SS type A sorting domain-containing protein [Bacteroidota bacterium]
MIILAFSFCLKAQYVTIPDTNFVAWLQHYYPACMSGNQMDTTCAQIHTATEVHIGFQHIADLTGITYFSNLQTLYCYNNQLTFLPTLPNSIQYIQCQSNYSITYITNLPTSLRALYCYENLLTSLPPLPVSLEILSCRNNLITVLPNLPNSLIELDCGNNHLSSLPALPLNLQKLSFPQNQLTILPSLPNTIQHLECNNNLLNNLPALPSSLTALWCNNNQLTTLPSLPNTLLLLNCQNNHITNLMTFPDSLYILNCSNNNINCFPSFSNNFTSGNLNISGNPFTCLPNYVPAMNAATLAFPLCINGDILNNPNACNSATGITGFSFKDNNSNCIYDAGDVGLSNISVKLYDSLSNLVAHTYSATNGIYHFSNISGTHTVKIDTLGMPYTMQCAYPGVDSTVHLTPVNPLVNDVNFDIICRPGFDVGVQSIYTAGLVFPGEQHLLQVVAGSLGNWYNLNCAQGISGTVQITIDGPVTFSSIAPGALSPSINGNIFTYTISDFGTINNQHDFGLMFTTNTNAQIGNTICVTVVVTPTAGDNNLDNNIYHFCYMVWNSFDPNMKEVYPIDVAPGFQDYFTYTVHFQNTGTAPAINIRLVDTLSNNLDLETFQLLNYSHYNITRLEGNVLVVCFPNIQLPDSGSNQEGSKGFVQYRIKPKSSWAIGTQIENTANIYFDFNPPIATNTTVNEYDLTTGIHENEKMNFTVYPNPFNSSTTVQFNKKVSDGALIIYDMLGQELKVIDHISGDKVIINRENISNGMYFIRLRQDNKIIDTGKILIQ